MNPFADLNRFVQFSAVQSYAVAVVRCFFFSSKLSEVTVK